MVAARTKANGEALVSDAMVDTDLLKVLVKLMSFRDTNSLVIYSDLTMSECGSIFWPGTHSMLNSSMQEIPKLVL